MFIQIFNLNFKNFKVAVLGLSVPEKRYIKNVELAEIK